TGHGIAFSLRKSYAGWVPYSLVTLLLAFVCAGLWRLVCRPAGVPSVPTLRAISKMADIRAVRLRDYRFHGGRALERGGLPHTGPDDRRRPFFFVGAARRTGNHDQPLSVLLAGLPRS